MVISKEGNILLDLIKNHVEAYALSVLDRLIRNVENLESKKFTKQQVIDIIKMNKLETEINWLAEKKKKK